MGIPLQTELPEQLMRDAQTLVDHGWAPSVNALLAEALRRYLESHREGLTEQFLREDVTWGLHGRG